MRNLKELFGEKIIFEKATLDDIVVYYSKKDVK